MPSRRKSKQSVIILQLNEFTLKLTLDGNHCAEDMNGIGRNISLGSIKLKSVSYSMLCCLWDTRGKKITQKMQSAVQLAHF